jgi:Uncharacterized conserved protein (DUF2088).
MLSLSVPFGPASLSLSVSAEPILPVAAEPLTDEVAAIQYALDHPVGCEPLAQIVKPGENVIIVVNELRGWRARICFCRRWSPP